MSRFSNKTMQAICDLVKSVDGVTDVTILPASEHAPKGIIQDCDAGIVTKEWVDQRSGAIPSGDDFYGTVTWRLGDFYVIAGFHT